MRLKDFIAENVDFDSVDLHLVVSSMQEGLKLADSLNRLIGEEVDIDIKKHREKRSLNANSYLRVLEAKIADTIGATKDEVHNDMLSRYGQYQLDENGNVVYCLYREDIDFRNLDSIHLKPTGHSEIKGNVKYQWFAVMKPSREYNTQEMAILIDGVVSECKDLDIETLSPDEIKRIEATSG